MNLLGRLRLVFGRKRREPDFAGEAVMYGFAKRYAELQGRVSASPSDELHCDAVVRMLHAAGIGDDDILSWCEDGSTVDVVRVFEHVWFAGDDRSTSDQYGTVRGWETLYTTVSVRRARLLELGIEGDTSYNALFASLRIFPSRLARFDFVVLSSVLAHYDVDDVDYLFRSGWSMTDLLEKAELGVDAELLRALAG